MRWRLWLLSECPFLEIQVECNVPEFRLTRLCCYTVIMQCHTSPSGSNPFDVPEKNRSITYALRSFLLLFHQGYFTRTRLSIMYEAKQSVEPLATVQRLLCYRNVTSRFLLSPNQQYVRIARSTKITVWKGIMICQLAAQFLLQQSMHYTHNRLSSSGLVLRSWPPAIILKFFTHPPDDVKPSPNIYKFSAN